MWVRELQIEGFGIFADFRLTGLERGLTVLLGANEAGKSTLLAFVRSILFGFPDGRTRDNLYPPLHGGRHGGRVVLVDAGGADHVVERFAGKRGGSVSVRATGGDEERVHSLLASTPRDVFRSVYAFGLTELQSLETLQADGVKTALYGASAGTAALALPRFQTSLERRLDALFKPAGENPLLNRALREYDALGGRIRAIQDGMARYTALAREIAAMDERIAAAIADAVALSRRATELEHRLRLLPVWIRVQRDRTQHAALPPCPEPAPSADTVARLEQVLQVQSLRREERERAELNVVRLLRERDAVSVDDALLARADAIRVLYAGADGFDERCERRARAQSSCAAAAQEIAGLLPELGPEWSIERVRGTDRSLFVHDALQAHRERLRGLENARRVAAAQRDGSAAAWHEAATEHEQAVAAERALEAAASRRVRRTVSVVAAVAVLAAAGVGAGPLWRDRVDAWLARWGPLAEEVRLAVGRDQLPTSVAVALAGVAATLVTVAGVLLVLVARRRRARTSARLRASLHVQVAAAAAEKAATEHTGSTARLAGAEAELGGAVHAWRAWLAESGLPTTVSPETAAHAIQTMAKILDLGERRDRLDTEVRQLEARQQEYRSRAAQTLAALNGSLGDDGAITTAVRVMHDALGIAATAATTRQGLDAQTAEARGQLAEATCRVDDADDAVRKILADSGAEHVDGLRARARLAAARDRLQTDIERGEQLLREIAGTPDLAAVERSLAGFDTLSVEQELTRIRAEQAAIAERLDGVRSDRAALIEEQRRLGSADELAALRAEQECVRARVAHLAREWARAAAARHLLGAAKARFERDHQPRVLQDAGRFLSRMTSARHTAVRAGLGPSDATLEILGANGVARRPDELSRGTQEQLYLALRLGYIVNHRRSGDELPVVMDDVLVNFDPVRAAGAARAIAALADRHQVLLFTCHPETATLICNTDPRAVLLTLQARDGSDGRAETSSPG